METIAPVVFGLIVLLVLFMIYRQIALLLQKVTERPLTEDAPSEEGQTGREESFWQWFSTSSVAVWLIHDNVKAYQSFGRAAVILGSVRDSRQAHQRFYRSNRGGSDIT